MNTDDEHDIVTFTLSLSSSDGHAVTMKYRVTRRETDMDDDQLDALAEDGIWDDDTGFCATMLDDLVTFLDLMGRPAIKHAVFAELVSSRMGSTEMRHGFVESANLRLIEAGHSAIEAWRKLWDRTDAEIEQRAAGIAETEADE